MNLPEFIGELFAEGRVAVPAPAEFTRHELQSAEQVLEQCDRAYRLDLPEGVPSYNKAAAIWAATQFYRACQLAMFRDADEAEIKKLSKTNLDGWDRTDVHYSVDLMFRFLPDLMRIVQSAAAGDPLIALLMNWGRCWPLSSVGIKGIGAVKLGPIANSPSLLLMYVDRILAREDMERMTNEPVRRSVQQALGMYSALAPKVAAAVQCR